MQECRHNQTKQGTATRSLMEHRFSTSVKVCADCDSVLWTNETQTKFNRWLSKIYSENSERFVLQPRFSKRTIKTLDALVGEFTGASRGLLMRAMSYVMIEDFPKDEQYAFDLNNVSNLPSFKNFVTGPTTHVRVRVNPRQYLDFQTWATVTGFTPSKVLETAVVNYLALLADYRLRHFDDQTRQMTERVVQLLKAA